MKLLVCGTRGKYTFAQQAMVALALFEFTEECTGIIEGCCPDSPDIMAEDWAKRSGIPIYHFPSTAGNYLKRNIEMVNQADAVLAFWDGFSYGTAHTIAQGVKKGIPVYIKEVKVKR